MLSSSTASITRPRAPAASTSRMRAARASSCVALTSESSSCCEIWERIAANKPAPRRRMISPKVATYQIVRRSRRRTRRCIPTRDEFASITEAVSSAADGLNQLVRVVVVDFPPQASHQDLEHVRERIVIFVPHVRRDCCAIDDLSAMEHEELEQGELL